MRREKSNIIYKKIKKSIISEEYKPGTLIPSERELMILFNVSRTPIRKALDKLVRENLIIKKIGDGTYVNRPLLNQGINKFYSFTEEMKKRGKKPTSQLISFEEKEEDFLGIFSEKIPIYEFERVRFADNEPLMFSKTLISKALIGSISKEELENKPLYDIFKIKLNFNLLQAEQTMKPCIITKEEAEYLKVNEGSLGMFVERKLFINNELLEYSCGIIRGDRFEFTIKYNQNQEE